MTDVLDRLRKTLADRYTIERELGRGGMATVYLAEDLKHHRHVAIKVLDPELARALGAERFLREVEVTANLNHPHILPLHDSGEADGFLYYVMPLVEGDSLRNRLNREKQLSVEESLNITSQVVGALSYAHSNDIVHRDIKPENILFQAGEVVVADFGIALAVDSAGGTRLTETGVSLGTPAYMSPELVSGEQDIDGRSDIYSLACVLYEMLAGDPPFIASNPRAVMAKHVTDAAPPITTVRSSVPLPVATALSKALGKAPADRFESAMEFAEALFAKAKEVEPEIKSIVVLPFENMSPDPENEYFSDGLTDELIADLSKLHSLRVISRNSAMQLKGTDKDTMTIGRELNIQYVLEGTVRRAGDRLRITAQLIDAERDAHLWTEKYDGVLEDVFEMQEEVSRSIVDALRLSLTPEEDRRLAVRPIEDVRAYQLYLMARQDFWAGTPDGLDRARRHLEHALEMIGENVVLLQGLAEVHLHVHEYGVRADEVALRQAEDLANRISAIHGNSAHGHYLKGRIERLRASVTRAIGDFERALAIDPSHSSSLLYLFHACGLQAGRANYAAPMREQIIAQNPLDFLTWGVLGMHNWMKGDLEEALCSYQSAGGLIGGSDFGDMLTAYVLIWLDRRDEALSLIEDIVSRETPDLFTEWGLCLRYAVEGDGAAAQKALGEQTRRYLWNDPEFMWLGASTFALAGEKEEALDWLEHVVDRGWINYPLFSQNDPLLESVRGEQRFEKLMVKVKREWEVFGAQLKAHG